MVVCATYLTWNQLYKYPEQNFFANTLQCYQCKPGMNWDRVLFQLDDDDDDDDHSPVKII